MNALTLRPHVVLAFLACIGSFCGCSLLADYAQTSYENRRSVTVDQGFKHNKGWYAVRAPEADYYYREDSNGIVFIPKADGGFYRGTYFVYTFAKDKVVKEKGEFLQGAFDWINANYVRKKTRGDQMQILKAEETTFQDKPALYLETFLGQKSHSGFGMTVIDRQAYGYVMLLFYHKDRLYWLYYANPGGLDQDSTAAQEKFRKFTEGVVLDPPPCESAC